MVLRPGAIYGLAWTVIVFVGGGFLVSLLVMWVGGLVDPSRAHAFNTGDALAGLVVLSICGAAGLAARQLHTPLILDVDAGGARLSRRGRLVRELHWDLLAWVKYRYRSSFAGPYYILKLGDRRHPWRPFSLNSHSYAIDSKALTELASIVSEVADREGIPVR